VIGRRRFPLAGAAALAIVIVLLASCQSAAQPAVLDPARPPQALAVDPSDGSLLKAAGGCSAARIRAGRGPPW